MNTIDWLSQLCISEVNLVHSYTLDANRFPMKNKGRLHHGLTFYLQNTETLTFHDKKLAVAPNSVLYLPKEEQYTLDIIGEQVIGITIDFEITSSVPCRPFYMKFGNNHTIRSDFADAEKVWRRKLPGYEMHCRAIVCHILSLMIKQEQSYLNPESYAKITEAVDYLHQHYTDNDFKIETLFHMAGISSKYFERLFFERFHTTPKEYVTFLKMERAKELLLGEKISIGNIAEQCGYSDIYHFSKAFKLKTGLSPSEYKATTLSCSPP